MTAAGVVKVLDFGLAKVSQAMFPKGNPEEQPTMTASREGAVLGTPAYMPPEQATGQPVDRRVDIWAFGVVLFEMLSGRRLYPQSSITETLAAVLRDEPRWNELPENTPAAIRALLSRCLERDAKRRLRDIGEGELRSRIAWQAGQTLKDWNMLRDAGSADGRWQQYWRPQSWWPAWNSLAFGFRSGPCRRKRCVTGFPFRRE